MNDNARRRVRVLLLGALAATLLGACGSPMQGTWKGTFDYGPIDAWTMTVVMPPEGLEGDLEVTLGDRTLKYRICKGTRTEARFELQFDRAHPDCVVTKGAKTDIHLLKGTVGEAVIFGTVWREGEKAGFFRAFLRKPEGGGLKEG